MTEPPRRPSPDLPLPPPSRDLPPPPPPVALQPSGPTSSPGAPPSERGENFEPVTPTGASGPPRRTSRKATAIGMSIVGVLLLGGGVLVALGGGSSPETATAGRTQTREATRESVDDGGLESSTEPTGSNRDREVTDGANVGEVYEPSTATIFEDAPEPTPDAATVYIDRDEIYDETVAVVWSQVGDANDSSWAETVQEQIDQYSSEYGGEFVGIRGDDFQSTKGGTVAVVKRGGFSDARAGASWCRSQGLMSDFACFGLRLSDDFDFEARGPNQRMYPDNL